MTTDHGARPNDATERAPDRRLLRLALLGAAVPLGWVLHDLGTCLASGRPALALAVLPTSMLAVLIGALFGWAASRRAFLFLAALVTGVWAVLPRFLDATFTAAQSWLPRALFLMVVAFAVGAAWGRRRPGAARVGLALAVLACAAIAEHLSERHAPCWPVVIGALVALPAGFLTSAPLRAAATVLALLGPLAWILHDEWSQLSPSRPDLPPPPVALEPGSAPNLVFVILDTVRADHLGSYGYARATTPLLDRWVAEHFSVHTSARSTSSWTLPSHASLFTGLMPAQHGSTLPGRYAQALHPEATTLAEHMRGAGYRTAGIFANNVYLRPRFGMDRGFEHFDDRLAGTLHTYLTLSQLLGFDQRAGHLVYRDGRQITDLAIDWLDGERRDEPFLLVLNYMDAHAPNMPPPPHDRAFEDTHPKDPLTGRALDLQGLMYDRELTYLDTHLDRLLSALKERGHFDDSVVIITSDHGEAIGDHGFEFHGWTLYEALVRVPLYVKPAGGRGAETSDVPINGAEVHHLALDLVGLGSAESQPSEVDGEWYVCIPGIGSWDEIYDHRDLTVDFVSWLDGTRKTIVSSKLDVEVYDLAADPFEERPLELSAEQVEADQRRALDWWESHPVEKVSEPGEEIDAETLERMRALGYVGDEDLDQQ